MTARSHSLWNQCKIFLLLCSKANSHSHKFLSSTLLYIWLVIEDLGRVLTIYIWPQNNLKNKKIKDCYNNFLDPDFLRKYFTKLSLNYFQIRTYNDQLPPLLNEGRGKCIEIHNPNIMNWSRLGMVKASFSVLWRCVVMINVNEEFFYEAKTIINQP